MTLPKSVTLVDLMTHTSTRIGGEDVVLRKREWVRSDDPRLAPPGGHRLVCGPEANKPSAESTCGIKAPTDTEPISTKPVSTQPVSTELKSTEPGSESSGDPSTTALTPTTSLSANSLIPKRKPQREATMSNHDFNEEDDCEDVDVEGDEQEDDDDDRPWPITKRTLSAIDGMSPAELENLIENVDDHERWRELREAAKRRTSQWLSGIKKAEEAPRCQFVKLDGSGCGSPAVKGETMCYFHGDARARRQTEEDARRLGIPTLEDKLSLQLAIMRICNQLVEKQIDEKTGRVVISALRLAHRNIGDQESLL
jgi:hypothetical protein